MNYRARVQLRLPSIFGSTLVALIAFGIGQPEASASEGPDSASSASSGHPCDDDITQLRPGDVIGDSGVATSVPLPGFAISSVAIYPHRAEILTVENQFPLGVSVTRCGSEDDDSESHRNARVARGLTSPPPCEDDAYNLYGAKWVRQFRWRFNAATRPSELTAKEAQDDLVAATRNVVRTENDCGLPDTVAAEHEFKGRTTRKVDIEHANSFSPACAAHRDASNTVDFGQIGSGAAIFLCNFQRADPGFDTIVESDLRLNKDDYAWTVDPLSPACDDELGVENYATTGRGSSFGLDPVPENIHGNLTMSTSPGGPCQNEASTLGLGDVLGLRQLY